MKLNLKRTEKNCADQEFGDDPQDQMVSHVDPS